MSDARVMELLDERDALTELVAALDAYAATDGLPWAERVAARKRVDDAREGVRVARDRARGGDHGTR